MRQGDAAGVEMTKYGRIKERNSGEYITEIIMMARNEKMERQRRRREI